MFYFLPHFFPDYHKDLSLCYYATNTYQNTNPHAPDYYPGTDKERKMPENSQATTLASSVLLLARAIDSYGYDSREMFARVDLDHSRLKDPLARYSFASVIRLWQLASETIDDPCLGLKVASFWHPATFHALGYSWLASKSLEDAFERSSRYTRIVNTDAKDIMQYEKTSDAYGIIIRNEKLSPNPFRIAVEYSVAMIIVMCRAAYGPDLNPLRVSFQHQQPDSPACFTEFFKAPVEFSQTYNAIWLDPEVVTEPLANANPELVRVNDQVVTDYLAHLDRNDLSMRVKSKLIERLPSGQVTEGEIASSINVSQRSLQRKLKEQGMSFTQLLEKTRQELGVLYVRDPQRSFNEIAFLLGFSEPGNFTRAFKRWYGQSPSQYRESRLVE
jgi:AraC-like DNA-binding protein